jgi:transposase
VLGFLELLVTGVADAGVRGAIEARRASLWPLPPRSPGLNPIEQAVAKLQALVRKVAPSTRETHRQSIGAIIQEFKPIERAKFLGNSVYKQSP